MSAANASTGGILPLTRGTGVVAVRAYLEKRHGPDAVAQAVGQLAPALAEPLGRIPIAHEWYPEESLLALVDAAAALYGEEIYDEVGTFAADFDLNFVHRFLLRFTSPMWILDRGARLWAEYHNTGKWTIRPGPQPRSLSGQLEDFGIVRATFCRSLTAWIRRAGQLTGAKDIVVTHSRCRAAAARVCFWEGHW